MLKMPILTALGGCGKHQNTASLYLITISVGFALGRGVGKFLSWQLGHSSLWLFFSNSDTCQVMAAMALGNCQQRCNCIPLPWPKNWLLANCPTAWAVTAVDIRTNFGNYQGFIHDYSSYGWLLNITRQSYFTLREVVMRCSRA